MGAILMVIILLILQLHYLFDNTRYICFMQMQEDNTM